MPLVKVVPYMVLHQKTHVPVSVNFLGSQMAFQHPVRPFIGNQVGNTTYHYVTRDPYLFFQG